MAFDPNSFTQATSFLNSLNNFSSPQKHEIITVSSLQQVKDFAMNKGDSYLLLDPNSDLLYVREMDSLGKSTIRAFRLAECTDEIVNNTTPVTISKTEYEKLIKRLEQLEGKDGTKKSSGQPELNLD